MTVGGALTAPKLSSPRFTWSLCTVLQSPRKRPQLSTIASSNLLVANPFVGSLQFFPHLWQYFVVRTAARGEVKAIRSLVELGEPYRDNHCEQLEGEIDQITMELEEARTKLRDLSNVNEEVTPELERLKVSD